jgi:hypothetical protein
MGFQNCKSFEDIVWPDNSMTFCRVIILSSSYILVVFPGGVQASLLRAISSDLDEVYSAALRNVKVSSFHDKTRTPLCRDVIPSFYTRLAVMWEVGVS